MRRLHYSAGDFEEVPIKRTWRVMAGRVVVPGWVVLLTAVLVWPTLRASGYLLGHDMVFTPRQPLDLPAFGVSSAAPRAVPVDAVVALGERLVDGAVIGRIAVALPLLAAGLGAAALLHSTPLPARLAGATAALWNPFVVERLALGQWALLWCYAALPWLVVAITRGRGAAGWLACGLAVAAASITPTGGLIATATAIAVATATKERRRDVLATAALAVTMQLPWVVPAAVSTASATSDPAGVAAFASRGEHPGGVLFSLLGGGGIWDADVVPGSRGGVLPWIWLLVLAAAAVYGAPRLIAVLGGRVVAALAALAGAGLLLAVLPSLPGGAALVRGTIEHVPGAGLLRDAQKWLPPLVVLEALLLGAAAARLADWLTVAWRPALLAAAAVVPVILLPDAAATLRPTLEPVHYPADWSAVAGRVHGDAAILPWGSYRSFPWAPGRTVLDPAPRLLPTTTVVDDRLAVGATVLSGEDKRAAAVGRALRAGPGLPAGLAADGISWVVVEHDVPGKVPSLAGLREAYRGRDVSLYRVPGRIADRRPSTVRIAAVLAGDALAVLVLLGLAGSAAWQVAEAGRRNRRALYSPAQLESGSVP